MRRKGEKRLPNRHSEPQRKMTESKGTVIMCTVKGDIHDVGKNLVIMMLEGAGFDIVDLGVDLADELLIQEVKKIKPDILGLSALLTKRMQEIKTVIEALETNGLRNSLKVMIGGAAVDKTFADQIGADGYVKDAAKAVELVKRLMAEK
jgi:5-methyltetrahydrofolate--homocysteine methyltransferase